MIKSIVIVKGSYGYIAYLRFTNRFLDADISASNQYMIYNNINRYLYQRGIEL